MWLTVLGLRCPGSGGALCNGPNVQVVNGVCVPRATLATASQVTVSSTFFLSFLFLCFRTKKSAHLPIFTLQALQNNLSTVSNSVGVLQGQVQSVANPLLNFSLDQRRFDSHDYLVAQSMLAAQQVQNLSATVLQLQGQVNALQALLQVSTAQPSPRSLPSLPPLCSVGAFN